MGDAGDELVFGQAQLALGAEPLVELDLATLEAPPQDHAIEQDRDAGDQQHRQPSHRVVDPRRRRLRVVDLLCVERLSVCEPPGDRGVTRLESRVEYRDRTRGVARSELSDDLPGRRRQSHDFGCEVVEASRSLRGERDESRNRFLGFVHGTRRRLR